MKKIFLTTMFVFCVSGVFAQELQSVNYTTNEINESQLVLSTNWITKIENNSVLIYNGNIKNESNKNVRNINLELYLVPQKLKQTAGAIKGFHVTKVPFKDVAKKSSLVGVNIENEVSGVPPAGLYDPILILTDKNGKVLTYQKVNSVVESDGAKIAVKNIPLTPDGKVMKTPDLYPSFQMDIKEDNSIALENEWKVEVDFKNFMVKVIGGDISNKTSRDLNNVVLDVFLTKDVQNQVISNFDAVHIASAELSNKIESYKKFVDTTITTNLTTIPQNGTYHILLTLSVKDENGNSVVRTKRAFLDTISF